ncbi:hypothetical protein RPALISO_193 [Ruegeria phage RpAliso]|nr:hypothetical protein RPALISO_193 [Ruegeria phage RpAliso]
MDWTINQDHWEAKTPFGKYSVGDAGGRRDYLTIPNGCINGHTYVVPYNEGRKAAWDHHAALRDGVSPVWIVNESGQNVAILAGLGSDGCVYNMVGSIDNDSVIVTAERLDIDPNNEVLIDGTFDVHEKPFVMEAA